jgi:hypothetical protein
LANSQQQARRKASLTRSQKRKLAELKEFESLCRLDFRNIAEYGPGARTPILDNMRKQFVTSQIVFWYTYADELLNWLLRDHFLGRGKYRRRLRRRKLNRTFDLTLEELYLMQKLRLARQIWPRMPKRVRKTVENLNSIRNAVAHTFFPESSSKSKPIFHGKSVFTLEGINELQQDVQSMQDALIRHLVR